MAESPAHVGATLQAKELVEQAYNASGGLPVYLAGHSNGPLYALALLNSTTPQWRQQYVGEPLLWEDSIAYEHP